MSPGEHQMIGKSLFAMDVETTGHVPGIHSTVSLGCTHILSSQTMYWLVRPEPSTVWSKKAESIHTLDRTMLMEHGKPIAHVLQELSRFTQQQCGDEMYTLVNWRAGFDACFIQAEYYKANLTHRMSHRYVCLAGMWHAFGNPSSHSFEEMLAVMGIKRPTKHHAGEDSKAAAKAYLLLQQSWFRQTVMKQS